MFSLLVVVSACVAVVGFDEDASRGRRQKGFNSSLQVVAARADVDTIDLNGPNSNRNDSSGRHLQNRPSAGESRIESKVVRRTVDRLNDGFGHGEEIEK